MSCVDINGCSHTKCKDSRLKGWQIAVIVTGVVLFTGALSPFLRYYI